MQTIFKTVVIISLVLILQSHAADAERETAKREQKVITNSIGMEFALIPAGSFNMGTPSDWPPFGDDERQHRVTISKPFYLQTTEVTQGQWRNVMGNNPSHFTECGDDCPVEDVSWDDCQEFIKKLNRTEGETKYRLPTEAEWEYACRAGTETDFYFGKCLSTDEANYNGNHFHMPDYIHCKRGEYRFKTCPSAIFSANALGLQSMPGNVYEWCQDWYGDYPSDDVTDPQGPSSDSERVVRGGCWFSPVWDCRSAARYHFSPDYRAFVIGFRLASSLP